MNNSVPDNWYTKAISNMNKPRIQMLRLGVVMIGC